MHQTKLESIIERVLDGASGWAIALIMYSYVINPLWPPWVVVSCFTVISLVRGYYWRRCFNNGIHKIVHKALIKIIKIRKRHGHNTR